MQSKNGGGQRRPGEARGGQGRPGEAQGRPGEARGGQGRLGTCTTYCVQTYVHAGTSNYTFC